MQGFSEVGVFGQAELLLSLNFFSKDSVVINGMLKGYLPFSIHSFQSAVWVPIFPSIHFNTSFFLNLDTQESSGVYPSSHSAKGHAGQATSSLETT